MPRDKIIRVHQVNSLTNLSCWAFLLTFAGVDLRINFKEMQKQGLRPFIVRALGEVVIAAITPGLVLGEQAGSDLRININESLCYWEV